jgi:hypothetical protein
MLFDIFDKILITSNAFYVLLTPSTHGDFVTYAFLLRSYGVWTRFPSTFVVGIFSKHGIYVVLKKSKMWKCVVESFNDVMYMFVVALALGSRPKQGVAKVRATRETWESPHMLLGVQRV